MPRSIGAAMEVTKPLFFCVQRCAGGKYEGGSESRLSWTSQGVRGKFMRPDVTGGDASCKGPTAPRSVHISSLAANCISARSLLGATIKLGTKWPLMTRSDISHRNSGKSPCSGQTPTACLLLFLTHPGWNF